jgi:hypothetical protein
MDNPRLHYLAGQSYFIGQDVPLTMLYNSTSAYYRQAYLLPQKYADWDTLPFSQDTFQQLLLATKGSVNNILLSLYHPVILKAYLYDPEMFPLSPDLSVQFKVELFPFLLTPQPADEWAKIGLDGASFRQKAEVLLQHIQQFRNWIVPYRIDGFRTVLQQGMTQGQDAYERNWCTLQLALLLIREDHDLSGAEVVLKQLIRQPDGTIAISPEDYGLFVEVNQWASFNRN